MRVFVYFNLHKKCWSIKALQGSDKGRVIYHSNYVSLRNCRLRVSEAGRKRVLASKRKNVHAGVEGDLFTIHSPMTVQGTVVTYNPYKYQSFVNAITKEPVIEANVVDLIKTPTETLVVCR